MNELIVAADIAQLERVLDFVNEQLDENECPQKIQYIIDVAVEEIFVNIASYAYSPDEGEAIIRCTAENAPRAIAIQFIDSGKEYNPLARKDPDISLSAEERQIGGLGVYMVKKSMDSVSYEYLNGRNIFTIKKKF